MNPWLQIFKANPQPKHFLARAQGHVSGLGGQTLHQVDRHLVVLAQDKADAETKVYQHFRAKDELMGKMYHVHIEVSPIEILK